MKLSSTFVLLALAACGKVNNLADASNGTDTPGAFDAGTQVTVTVLDPNTGAPISGAPVVFLDKTSTEVGHPSTDANGKASADLPGGGSITAIIPSGANAFELQSVLAVKGGDSITLNAPPPDNSTATFTVTLASDASAGAVTYDVFGPCGTQTNDHTLTTATLTITGYCKTATMDLVAVAYDGNFNPIGYVEQSGVAYSPGGSTSMPSTWQSLKNFTGTATNLPAEVSSVYMQRSWPDINGYTNGDSGTPTGTSFSASLLGPTTTTAMIDTQLRSSTGSLQHIRQVNAGNATSYALDVGNNMLAWVGAPSLDVTTGMVTTPTVGTSHGTPPDLFAMQVDYSRTVNQTTTSYFWIIYAPDVLDLTLPKLPAAVGDVTPEAGDFTSSNNHAALVELDNVDGYDVAHLNPTVTLSAFFDNAGRGPATARYSQSPQLK